MDQLGAALLAFEATDEIGAIVITGSEKAFAAGADMASVMAGHYPAGGINLGPAMVFGHIAARASAMD